MGRRELARIFQLRPLEAARDRALLDLHFFNVACVRRRVCTAALLSWRPTPGCPGLTRPSSAVPGSRRSAGSPAARPPPSSPSPASWCLRTNRIPFAAARIALPASRSCCSATPCTARRRGSRARGCRLHGTPRAADRAPPRHQRVHFPTRGHSRSPGPHAWVVRGPPPTVPRHAPDHRHAAHPHVFSRRYYRHFRLYNHVLTPVVEATLVQVSAGMTEEPARPRPLAEAVPM